MTKPARLILALLTAVTAALGFAACGDDRVEPAAQVTDTSVDPSTTQAPAPRVVLRYVTTGGCEVLGPNCPTYVLWSDGKVEISRTGVDGAPEITGQIPVAVATTWMQAVEALDPVALADEVGPGECASCVDGADIMLTLTRDSGVVVLDSTKVDFDPANAFFAGLETLMADVRSVGELPMKEA